MRIFLLIVGGMLYKILSTAKSEGKYRFDRKCMGYNQTKYLQLMIMWLLSENKGKREKKKEVNKDWFKKTLTGT